MLCFEISDDKYSKGEWYKKFNEILNGLPEDTLLTIVDCHI